MEASEEADEQPPPRKQRPVAPFRVEPVECLRNSGNPRNKRSLSREYRMLEKPECLKDVVDVCCRGDCRVVLWASDMKAVLRTLKKRTFFLPEDYFHFRFNDMEVAGKSMEDVGAFLEYLLLLPDRHFERLILGLNSERIVPCTLAASNLARILDHPHTVGKNRQLVFRKMIFTVHQSRTIVNSGTGLDVVLDRCQFEDQGSSFVVAFQELYGQQKNSSMVHLHLLGVPFSMENWLHFLSLRHRGLRKLTLWKIALGVEACELLAVSNFQMFSLDGCTFDDNGATLIESVRRGREGVRNLSFGRSTLADGGRPFDSLETWEVFLRAALTENPTHLKRLELWNLHRRHQDVESFLQILTTALEGNRGLEELLLHVAWNMFDLRKLFQVLKGHPSLRSLDWKPNTTTRIGEDKKTEWTGLMKNLLVENRRLDDIKFDAEYFLQEEWDRDVAPRLECNMYRNRFLLLNTAGDARPALVARALGRVSSNQSLLWILLCQSPGIMAGHVGAA